MAFIGQKTPAPKKEPVKVPTIGTWLKLRSVSADTLGLSLPSIKNFPNVLYGVEIELENTRGIRTLGALIPKEDGSLRNNGMEYISYPWPYDWLVHELRLFYTNNKISDVNVSERCSVHVHLNCQPLTISQLQMLIRLYQVFERVLFEWIGGDRNKSIFCVPLSETIISQKSLKSDPASFLGTIKRWQKYTAFNLLPLTTQGTVEFRHMSGQGDPEKIIKWLAIIGCMYEYVLKNTNEEFDKFLIQLNSSSQYRALVDMVFGEYAKLFEGFNFQALMEDGVLNMKFMLLDTKTSLTPEDGLHELEMAVNQARINMQARARIAERLAQPAPPNVVIDDAINPFARVAEWHDLPAELRADEDNPI